MNKIFVINYSNHHIKYLHNIIYTRSYLLYNTSMMIKLNKSNAIS